MIPPVFASYLFVIKLCALEWINHLRSISVLTQPLNWKVQRRLLSIYGTRGVITRTPLSFVSVSSKIKRNFLSTQSLPYWAQKAQNDGPTFSHECYNVRRSGIISKLHCPFASSHYPLVDSTILLKDLHYAARQAHDSCVLLHLQTISF